MHPTEEISIFLGSYLGQAGTLVSYYCGVLGKDHQQPGTPHRITELVKSGTDLFEALKVTRLVSEDGFLSPRAASQAITAEPSS